MLKTYQYVAHITMLCFFVWHRIWRVVCVIFGREMKNTHLKRLLSDLFQIRLVSSTPFFLLEIN